MIDPATVSRILDAADIVDVVSDFVSLKKRGANWIGLCPFHNDRRPSFYVSRAKGICKCFSCGQGGSAVNFVMLHEQMTYVEALRYLAKKYHIEIQERELTDEEREAHTEREAMLVLNEWACQFFEKQLWETTEGQEIGLSYFRHRGFSDATIRKFRLGYSPDNRNALYKEATALGYNRDLLFKLGLCKDDNHGGGYDFYRGRVMFPIFAVAGNVIAFGGRTLKKEDKAKYFNSPDSLVYNKSKSTMYGLFQAKRAIARENKCFIVEGYADVISMHQAGFENVIASSGTALTEGHIHLLHRFTQNVTELFDGDEAGIHAALRGVDMLLKAGLNIKVLLLPDGEDPDSYAQSHSSSEVEKYIKENENDFIAFKTAILLKDSGNDPIRRAQAVTDVVKSISVIPDAITRSIYAKECAARFDIQEELLLQEIQKNLRKARDDDFHRAERGKRAQAAQEAAQQSQPQIAAPSKTNKVQTDKQTIKQEEDIIRYLIKYGMCYLCDTQPDADGMTQRLSVAEYVKQELDIDRIEFSVPVYTKVYNIVIGAIPKFYEDYNQFEAHESEAADATYRKRLSQLNPVGYNVNELEKKEKDIQSEVSKELNMQLNDYRMAYLERFLCSHPDDEVRNLAYNLISEKNQLSKIYTQNGPITTDFDRLLTIIPKAIYNLKNAIIEKSIKQLMERIYSADDAGGDLMKELQKLYEIRKQISAFIGDRVVNP